MEYQVRIKPSAQKELNKLPKDGYYKVLAVLTSIAKNPFSGKTLKGKFSGQWSVRVWPYRIIYEVVEKDSLVLIICLGHRSEIY